MFATEVGDALKGHLGTTQRAKTAHSAIPRRVTSPQHHLLQRVLCLTAKNATGMRTNTRRGVDVKQSSSSISWNWISGKPHTYRYSHSSGHRIFWPLFDVFGHFSEILTKVSLTKLIFSCQNPGYPGKYSTAGTCVYLVKRMDEGVCQIR